DDDAIEEPGTALDDVDVAVRQRIERPRVDRDAWLAGHRFPQSVDSVGSKNDNVVSPDFSVRTSRAPATASSGSRVACSITSRPSGFSHCIAAVMASRTYLSPFSTYGGSRNTRSNGPSASRRAVSTTPPRRIV